MPQLCLHNKILMSMVVRRLTKEIKRIKKEENLRTGLSAAVALVSLLVNFDSVMKGKIQRNRKSQSLMKILIRFLHHQIQESFKDFPGTITLNLRIKHAGFERHGSRLMSVLRESFFNKKERGLNEWSLSICAVLQCCRLCGLLTSLTSLSKTICEWNNVKISGYTHAALGLHNMN